MAYSILSEAARHNLEQERARLVRDREAILASVTAELDRLHKTAIRYHNQVSLR